MGKIKVNWKLEYMKDNIFNIVIALSVILILGLDVHKYYVLFPIVIGFFVNMSALRFFVEKEKYH